MGLLKQSAAIIGAGLGLVYAPVVARSEKSQTSERSWLSWLVGEPSDELVGQQLPIRPGRVVVWGGAFGRSPKLVEPAGDNIVKVAAGNGFGAAVDVEGNVCGFVASGEHGQVEPIKIRGRATDIAVREAAREIVILDASGRVMMSKCSKEYTFEPAKLLEGAINRSKIEKVRCGKSHCVAITQRGTAFSWGSSNSHGQLGLGGVGDLDGTNPEIPKQMKLPDGISVRDAGCGDRHTVLLDRNGVLFGVGDDHWAQLGIGAEPWLNEHEKASGVVRKSNLVEEVAGMAVAGGGQHSVLLVRDGTVFSFGFNQWGQLGHHNYSSLAPPSPIADYKIRATAISAGDNHTCIVKDNGEMWCIGGNDHGQLGRGNLQPSMAWRRVRLETKTLQPSYIYLSGNTSAAVLPTDKNPHSSVP